MLSVVDEHACTRDLLGAATRHAHALAEVSAHTAAGLRVITGAMGIADLPAAQRSVRRERRRVERSRVLARTLYALELAHPAPATPTLDLGSVPDLAVVESRAASERAGWLLLIELRRWNIRHWNRHHDALAAAGEELVPALLARREGGCAAAGSCLAEYLAGDAASSPSA